MFNLITFSAFSLKHEIGDRWLLRIRSSPALLEKRNEIPAVKILLGRRHIMNAVHDGLAHLGIITVVFDIAFNAIMIHRDDPVGHGDHFRQIACDKQD